MTRFFPSQLGPDSLHSLVSPLVVSQDDDRTPVNRPGFRAILNPLVRQSDPLTHSRRQVTATAVLPHPQQQQGLPLLPLLLLDTTLYLTCDSCFPFVVVSFNFLQRLPQTSPLFRLFCQSFLDSSFMTPDNMSHRSQFIASLFLVIYLQSASASWPMLQNLGLTAGASGVWPGMRIMPSGGMAQPSVIQPIALRDMQLAYPIQPVNMGQFSPLEIASEQELIHFHRNQNHRRRMNRERERLRQRERERELRMRQRNMHALALPSLKHERSKNNNLLESSEAEVMSKNKVSYDDNVSMKQPQTSEGMRASSDDFVLMQKLNNEHIRTTRRPQSFDDDVHHFENKPSVNGQIDMMPPDPPTKPVDIRRKTMASPDGQVTYITEMLYDVGDGNGNSKVTRPPVAPSFIPAPNDVMSFSPTDDPRTVHPFITLMPPASNVLSRPPEVPSKDWQNMPTPPTPFRSRSRDDERRMEDKQTEQTEGSERRESNSFPTTDKNNFHIQNRHQTDRSSGFRSTFEPNNRQSFESVKGSAPSVTKEKTWKGSSEGLGAAAIAGIVIGSLVSITLLAGELFSSSTIFFFLFFSC